MKTDEEKYKERLRRKFRLEATARREQEMREELAEFMLRFHEKYNVLLDVKIKPMKTAKGNSKRKDDVDEN